MITLLLLIILPAIVGYIKAENNKKYYYVYIGELITIALGVAIMVTIESNTIKPVQVVTPSKYLEQSYYIDNANKIYTQQNNTTKVFSEDISSKIEYNTSNKLPSIKFKTIKTLKKRDYWIPFKYETKTETSIDKVILPKSEITQKFTKVEVKAQ